MSSGQPAFQPPYGAILAEIERWWGQSQRQRAICGGEFRNDGESRRGGMQHHAEQAQMQSLQRAAGGEATVQQRRAGEVCRRKQLAPPQAASVLRGAGGREQDYRAAGCQRFFGNGEAVHDDGGGQGDHLFDF